MKFYLGLFGFLFSAATYAATTQQLIDTACVSGFVRLCAKLEKLQGAENTHQWQRIHAEEDLLFDAEARLLAQVGGHIPKRWLLHPDVQIPSKTEKELAWDCDRGHHATADAKANACLSLQFARALQQSQANAGLQSGAKKADIKRLYQDAQAYSDARVAHIVSGQAWPKNKAFLQQQNQRYEKMVAAGQLAAIVVFPACADCDI